MNQSSRLSLPLLAAAQAQKELTHNEALALIDLAVSPAVEEIGSDTPPQTPIEGQCYALGIAPSGDWAGQAHALAGFTAGGWRFVDPPAGMRVFNKSDGTLARFDGSSWVAAPAAVADATGGDEVAVINTILAALRAQGIIAS